ncbi:hypothetical protein [Fluviicola sp.]|uniref:hypothetical protein n=1 Tax=Fluviicola sp. TaxID=1917219 RepID=UPI0031D88592
MEAINEGQNTRQKEILTVDIDLTLKQIYVQKKSDSPFNDVSYLYSLKRIKNGLNGKSGKEAL